MEATLDERDRTDRPRFRAALIRTVLGFGGRRILLTQVVGKTLADQKHDQRQGARHPWSFGSRPQAVRCAGNRQPGDADVALSMAHLLAAISLEMERKRGTL